MFTQAPKRIKRKRDDSIAYRNFQPKTPKPKPKPLVKITNRKSLSPQFTVRETYREVIHPGPTETAPTRGISDFNLEQYNFIEKPMPMPKNIAEVHMQMQRIVRETRVLVERMRHFPQDLQYHKEHRDILFQEFEVLKDIGDAFKAEMHASLAPQPQQQSFGSDSWATLQRYSPHETLHEIAIPAFHHFPYRHDGIEPLPIHTKTFTNKEDIQDLINLFLPAKQNNK